MEIKSNCSVEELTKLADDKLQEDLKNGNYLDVLDRLSNLYKYSIRNQSLLSYQNPNATIVNNMNGWKYHHCMVNKDEKALKILQPNFEKVEVEKFENGVKRIMHEQQMSGLKVGYVFDVSQTNATKMAEPTLTDVFLRNHFEEVKSYLETLEPSFDVDYTDQIKSDCDFYKDKYLNKYHIRDGMSQQKVIETLVSVFARVFVDKSKNTNGLTDDDVENIKEIEADSISYAVCKRLGIPKVREYDFSKLNDLSDEQREKFAKNLDTIRSIVHKILFNLELSIYKMQREDEKQNETLSEINNVNQPEVLQESNGVVQC